jgi:3-phosphoshikimate 1-carboxyvinyltransferase
MKFVTVKKTSGLRGIVTLPSSKSQSIRALIISLLAKGKSTVLTRLLSEDVQAALKVCQALGLIASEQGKTLHLQSSGIPFQSDANSYYTHNSGITTLFIMPVLGLRANGQHEITLDGGAQMRARPVKPLVDALNQLGMHTVYLEREGYLPIRLSGHLQGGTVVVDGSSSQYLSALLISLPCSSQDSVITVNHLCERPYVDMTLAWLQQQGIQYTHQRTHSQDTFTLKGQQSYKPVNTIIPGDYSSASCLIAAAVLLPGEVTLEGLLENDTQGDKQLIPLLQAMGADITIQPTHLHIKGGKPLKGITIDATEIPALLPALAVIATAAEGRTEILNVQHARIKETDRIASMKQGLERLGARVEELEDGLIVHHSVLTGASVNGFNDHRTVMALTIAGLMATGTTQISDADAIQKTFPQFFSMLRSLGADIREEKKSPSKHLLLIGFKHVGKTVIGAELAKSLNSPFIDLDTEILKQALPVSTCRELMLALGEAAFRELESAVLAMILSGPPAVVSLGGGTPLSAHNQTLIVRHPIMHIVAPREIVFERIMAGGRPAFFDEQHEPYETFSHLWQQRLSIFEKLATMTVNNDSSLEHAVSAALKALENANETRD